MHLAIGVALLIVAAALALRSRPALAIGAESGALSDAGAAEGFEFSDFGAAAMSFWDGSMESVSKVFSLPAAGEPYREAIERAEAKYDLPPSLLARLLQQESGFRADAVGPVTRTGERAQGIAQFMPGTARDMGIDPFNAAQAIDAAAKYLRLNFNVFGNWAEALAAYNWGPGNQRRDRFDGITGNDWPEETRNYVRKILADVGL